MTTAVCVISPIAQAVSEISQMHLTKIAAILAVTFSTAACADHVQTETGALTLSDEALAQRQVAARRFETTDQVVMLRASANVLQDLGFSIDETEPQLGLLNGSKSRGAVESGQVAGAVIIAVLFGVATSIETTQKIKVSVVATRTGDGKDVVVRTSFQRVIWNSQNKVSRLLTIKEPAIYQQFYDKLAQSVFLQAHLL